MATLHVAGYVASLLTIDSSLTPAAVDSTIKSRSLKDALSEIRGLTNGSTFINVIQNPSFLHSGRDHQWFAIRRSLKIDLFSGYRPPPQQPIIS